MHDRWWEIVNSVIDLPAHTQTGWAAKAAMLPAVFRDVGDEDTADHTLALSLMRDVTGQNEGGPDADLLAACGAFQAVHRETKDPRRGDTDADDNALGPVVDRWYAALDAVVAVPARTAAGQQAKLWVVYTALWDAMKDEPLCGHKEEFAALRVLAELIGADDLVLPEEEPGPAAAPAGCLTEDDEAQVDAIFDLGSVFADMQADIDIIKHVARTEAEVSVDVWVRIHDHLDLALDTLEGAWKLALEHQHVLRDVLRAERAAHKLLQRTRNAAAQPGSPADIEDAEGLWSFMQNISRMVLKRHDDAAAAA